MTPIARFSEGGAELRLDGAWYGRGAVEAAAAALAGRARVALAPARGALRVSIVPLKRGDVRALAGEFLDEALNHQLREEVVAQARSVTGPVLGRVFASGFTAVPKDPLEQMEPTVAEDREAETEALLAKARRGQR